MLVFVAAFRKVRDAMARDQRRPASPNVGLLRLLAGEIALLGRRVGRWKVTSAAACVALAVLAVQVGLSDATPGPVLTAPARWVVALVAAAVAISVWAIFHAVRHDGS